MFSAKQRLKQLHLERTASLNAVCLDACADRMQERCAAQPICVIHGPFGSGKSTLLVAMLHQMVNREPSRAYRCMFRSSSTPLEELQARSHLS